MDFRENDRGYAKRHGLSFLWFKYFVLFENRKHSLCHHHHHHGGLGRASRLARESSRLHMQDSSSNLLPAPKSLFSVSTKVVHEYPNTTRLVQVRPSPRKDTFYQHLARISIDNGADCNLICLSALHWFGAKVTPSSQSAHQAESCR